MYRPSERIADRRVGPLGGDRYRSRSASLPEESPHRLAAGVDQARVGVDQYKREQVVSELRFEEPPGIFGSPGNEEKTVR